MHRRNLRDRRLPQRLQNGSAAALATLLAAPGADVFYDANDTTRITKDGSEKVSLLASRVGVHTVEQASGPLQPVWGATSPSGKRGITFTLASGHRLTDPLTALGALYDASQGYSSLLVVKYAAPTTAQVAWSFGNSAATTDTIRDGTVATSGNDRRTRGTPALGNAISDGGAHSTTIVCGTTVYTGSAYSSWLNGTLSINASSNTRAPALDELTIGAARSGASFALPFGGEFYGLILSRTQWSTAQRQALEVAAKVYYGTP